MSTIEMGANEMTVDVSEELERLAALENEGWELLDDAVVFAHPSLTWEQAALAWEDFRQAARDRDAVAPPATKDWREVLGEDVASTQDEAYQVLCERADEALAVLRHGRPERAEGMAA